MSWSFWQPGSPEVVKHNWANTKSMPRQEKISRKLIADQGETITNSSIARTTKSMLSYFPDTLKFIFNSLTFECVSKDYFSETATMNQ